MSAYFRHPLGAPDDPNLFLDVGVLADVIDGELYPSSVAAGMGSFALSGTSASLTHGHRMVADAGAFVETGAAISTRLTSTAAGSAFTFTGTDVELEDVSPYDTQATGYLGAYLGMMIIRLALDDVSPEPLPNVYEIGDAEYQDHVEQAIARLCDQFQPRE